MNPERRRAAFTLMEMMVVCALGLFLAIITGMAMRQSARVLTNVSGKDAAMRNLLQARRGLENDLALGSQQVGHLSVEAAPGSRGGGADGDAVCMLSAVNATSGQVEVLSDGSGSPYFFQNIVIYPTTPANHDQLFGTSCVGGNDGGYDYNCPHKMLLRRRADQNAAFDLSNPTTQDTLLSPLAPHLTRPTGFPRGADVSTVAVNLLSFRVERLGRELRVDLQAVALADAQRRMGIGTQSFASATGQPFCVRHQFSVFLKN